MDQTPEVNTSPGKWLPAVALAWLIPGGGHFLLKRPGRGGLIAASVAAMFLLGLMMRGALFQPQSGDLLTTVIYYGGFVGDLMSGLLYFVTVWLGDAPPGGGGARERCRSEFGGGGGFVEGVGVGRRFENPQGKKDLPHPKNKFFPLGAGG